MLNKYSQVNITYMSISIQIGTIAHVLHANHPTKTWNSS